MSGSPKRTNRNANGDGTIEQLPSGLFRAVRQIQGKRIKGEACKTKTQARESLRRKIQNQNAAGDVRQSFGMYASSMAEQRKDKISPTTYATECSWAKSLLQTPLGAVPVAKVTRGDLEQWARLQTVKPVTLRKRIGWLHGLLKMAGNPARMDVPARTRHTRRPLSPNERDLIRGIISALPSERQLAVYLCWFLGLRRSEACGLMHEDRDGDGIRVRRVVVIGVGEVGTKLYVKHKAKSPEGHGWIPLPTFLKPLIGQGKGFVLGSESRPLHPKTLTGWFTELKKGTPLELVPYMGAHAMRRTFGMMLLESGADVVTAAATMRHDPKMLLDEYARSRTDLMQDAVRKAFDQ